jgi:hypothetical protein
MMIDNAFPVQMGGNGDTIGFLREYLGGFQNYQQEGTDIPSQAFSTEYGQEQGGPLISRTIRYSPPNAILKTPHLDSPYMDQLLERGFKPLKPPTSAPAPKGPQLPYFL